MMDVMVSVPGVRVETAQDDLVILRTYDVTVEEPRRSDAWYSRRHFLVTRAESMAEASRKALAHVNVAEARVTSVEESFRVIVP